MASQLYRCPSCGAIDHATVFCASCGMRFGQPGSGSQENAPRPPAPPPWAPQAPNPPLGMPQLCQYPGCATAWPVERCSNSDGLLVCAAHRVYRDGAYVCAVCDSQRVAAEVYWREQAAYEARRKYGESHQLWLLLGNLGSIAVGVAFLISGQATSARASYSDISDAMAPGTSYVLGLSLIVFSLWAIWDADWFKHKTYDLKGGRKALYWFAAVTGLFAGSIFIIIAVLLGGAAAGSAQRSQTEAAVREGVRDGINDARGHY